MKKTGLQRPSCHWWRSHAFSSITISFSLFLGGEMWKICFPLYCCLFLIHLFSNQRLFPNLYKNTSEISLGTVRCGNFIGFCFFEQKNFKLLWFLLLLSFFSCSFLAIFQFRGSCEKKNQVKLHKKSRGITDNINLLRFFFLLLLCSDEFFLFRGSHPSRATYMKQNRKHKN